MVGTAQRWHTFKLVAAVGVIVEESFAFGSNCTAALPVETVLAEQQFWKSSS